MDAVIIAESVQDLPWFSWPLAVVAVVVVNILYGKSVCRWLGIDRDR